MFVTTKRTYEAGHRRASGGGTCTRVCGSTWNHTCRRKTLAPQAHPKRWEREREIDQSKQVRLVRPQWMAIQHFLQTVTPVILQFEECAVLAGTGGTRVFPKDETCMTPSGRSTRGLKMCHHPVCTVFLWIGKNLQVAQQNLRKWQNKRSFTYSQCALVYPGTVTNEKMFGRCGVWAVRTVLWFPVMHETQVRAQTLRWHEQRSANVTHDLCAFFSWAENDKGRIKQTTLLLMSSIRGV